MAKSRYHWYKWLPIGNVIDFVQNLKGNGDGSFMSQVFNGGWLSQKSAEDNISSAVDALTPLIDKENQFNIDQTNSARQWEEYMSNTATQRQVADIKAAGLNPWLALNGGSVSGASTPSVTQSQQSSGMSSAIASVLASQTNMLGRLGSSAISALAKIALKK